MDDLSAPQTIYKSGPMLERRRRVLEEARLLLEERGFADFTTRELCERSQIATRTFYNAFGSKDRVIAQSIYNFMREREAQRPSGDARTVEARLVRLVNGAATSIRFREFTVATMSVYGQVPGFPEIRAAIRGVSTTPLATFVGHLQAAGQLARGTDPDWLIRLLVTTHFALLGDWCVSEIDDDRLIDGGAEAFLALLSAAVQGTARDDAQAWLETLRARDPRWTALRATAAHIPSL